MWAGTGAVVVRAEGKEEGDEFADRKGRRRRRLAGLRVPARLRPGHGRRALLRSLEAQSGSCSPLALSPLLARVSSHPLPAIRMLWSRFPNTGSSSSWRSLDVSRLGCILSVRCPNRGPDKKALLLAWFLGFLALKCCVWFTAAVSCV